MRCPAMNPCEFGINHEGPHSWEATPDSGEIERLMDDLAINAQAIRVSINGILREGDRAMARQHADLMTRAARLLAALRESQDIPTEIDVREWLLAVVRMARSEPDDPIMATDLEVVDYAMSAKVVRPFLRSLREREPVGWRWRITNLENGHSWWTDKPPETGSAVTAHPETYKVEVFALVPTGKRSEP